MRPHGSPKELEQRRQRAISLLQEGHQPVDIASMLGVDRRSVRRWMLDRIRLDDSAPVEIQVTELGTAGAELRHGGSLPYSPTALNSRLVALDEALPDETWAYGIGNFTPYGDVRELLGSGDDMFVIMRHADEIALQFNSIGDTPEGMKRAYILKADMYYKVFSVDNNVEPLPFHGMSQYPYPEGEAYPSDPDHEEYRNIYNTRHH